MKRLVALLALVVLGAAACTYGGTPVDPSALRVNGTVVVTVAELEEELAFLDANSDLAGAILGDPSALQGEVAGAYSPAASAALLDLHLRTLLAVEAATAQGIEVTDDDRAAAATELDSQLEGLGVSVDALPDALADSLVAGTAAQTALQAWMEENPEETPEITDADVAAFFEEVRGQLPAEVVCSRHILVAFPAAEGAEPGQPAEPSEDDDAAAKAEIDAVAERLAAGEDFAAVAEEASDDPGSAALGGDLGCGDPTQFVPEFAEAISTQDVGAVGEPVRTDFGWHLIEVTYRGEPTVDQFEDELRAQLEAQAAPDPNARMGELVSAVLADVDVVVDPRFGRWDPDLGGITAPEGAAAPPTTTPVDDPFAGLELP